MHTFLGFEDISGELDSFWYQNTSKLVLNLLWSVKLCL